MIFRFVAARKAEHSIKTMCRVLGVSGSGLNSAIDREADIRARLQQYWEASERGDVDAEHAIYAADAVLDYAQSGERFRRRSSIQAQGGGHPAERHFIIRRILGGGDLWVSECVITYDGVPTRSASWRSPTVS